jgi:23S rRNA pseudouridine2605 synthase
MRQKPDLRKSESGGDGGGERIAKVIARAGLASRREAEAWVKAGRVAVNGTILESPAYTVRRADRIEVDGQVLRAPERTRLFLYHKPKGLVTTNADPEGRATIFQHLPADLPRVVTVGRLDITSEGLLLLTNDGGLARTLELPATGWLRSYRVRANGRADQPTLDRLKNGVTIEGVAYGAVEATIDRQQGANLWLTVGIREGKNREVRKVLAHIGLKVNRLIRTAFGPFELGNLAPGAAEEVKTAALRETLGPAIAAEANADFSSALHEDAAPARAPAKPRDGRTPSSSRDDRSRGSRGQRNAGARDDRAGDKPRKPYERDRGAANDTRDARPARGPFKRPRGDDGKNSADSRQTRPREDRFKDKCRKPFGDSRENRNAPRDAAKSRDAFKPPRARDGAPDAREPRNAGPREDRFKDKRRKPFGKYRDNHSAPRDATQSRDTFKLKAHKRDGAQDSREQRQAAPMEDRFKDKRGKPFRQDREDKHAPRDARAPRGPFKPPHSKHGAERPRDGAAPRRPQGSRRPFRTPRGKPK